MGAAGSAWIKSRAASARGLRASERYGRAAHPVAVRAGQRWWPTSRPGPARRLTILIQRVDRAAEVAVGRREDAARQTVHLRVQRLLAVDSDGRGCHYEFLGWQDRVYRSVLTVLEVAGPRSWVCLPEWHHNRAFEFPSRLLPEPCRHGGGLARCKARLAAATAAALNLSELEVGSAADLRDTPPVGHPEILRAADAQRSHVGASCGDIVVTLAVEHWEHLARSSRAVALYLTGPRPPASADRHAYLGDGTSVTHVAAITAIRSHPTGFLLELDGATVAPLPEPRAVRRRAEWWRQAWQWRWWQLDEQT